MPFKGNSCPYSLFRRSRGLIHEGPQAQESQKRLVVRIANSMRGPVMIGLGSTSALQMEEGNGHACQGITYSHYSITDIFCCYGLCQVLHICELHRYQFFV